MNKIRLNSNAPAFVVVLAFAEDPLVGACLDHLQNFAAMLDFDCRIHFYVINVVSSDWVDVVNLLVRNLVLAHSLKKKDKN